MNSNVLPLTPGTYFISLRQDLIQFCQACTYKKSDKSKSSPHCKALILSVMEYWTNYKINHAQDLYIHLTIPQWIEALYHIFSYNAIADSLEELVYEEILSRVKVKSNKGGKDRYKYLLNYQEVAKALHVSSHTPKHVMPASDRLTNLHTMPYAEYLLTPEWQEKRKRALRFAQFRCQMCNSSQSLNVHHRTYERRGNERLGDLITLCQDCHEIFHANREVEG